MTTKYEPHEPEAGDLFAALPLIDAEAIRRLHARLVREAEQAGLLDVAYHSIDTPVGTLLLAATTRGLVRVAYEREDHAAVLARLAKEISPRVLHAPGRLDAAATEIDEYFAGRRTAFDLPLDFSLAQGFRRLVLSRLSAITYGHTVSYAQVAAAAGNPKAVRAVGTACATNPLPIVVPCHRVVRSDGSLGQYVGGADTKKVLLTLEAHA
jgi:methylated-DNA-[protein]-cysteine S-methyltransferase